MPKRSLAAIAVLAWATAACAGRPASSPTFESQVQASAEAAARTAPAGRKLSVELDRPVGTDVSYSGEPFTATLETPILATNDGVLIPKGARVRGAVVGVTLNPPSVTLRFDAIRAPAGEVPLDAVVIGVRDPDLALAGGLHAADEARFSTLTRKADLGNLVPPRVPGELDDAAREHLRVPVGAELQLMLASPLHVPVPR